ncbi:acyl-CoA dehydratase activase [bacterium]|nr:acyl-CoA dehydratase activase [bacterium]MCI0607012.1 acyl-CoA dehydratase activase [bacterium]
MMLYAGGVDVGSTQTKAIILDQARNLASSVLISTGAYVTVAAQNAFEQALQNSGLKRNEISYIIGTGYGRYKVTFGDSQITEISCHARGAHFLFPSTRTVIDMGGQDTKAIKIGPDGNVLDFAMNDKCAAGTGRFLAAAAEVMGLPLDVIGDISLRAKTSVRLSSVCAVFVESDIMSYLAQNKSIEDILGGVHSAIAARTMSLVRRVGVEKDIAFTGGVSRNCGMIHAMQMKLGLPLKVSEQSHFAGAIGAALFAMERAERLSFEGQPASLD